VSDPNGARTYVLSTAAVRWSINLLGAQRLHPTFVMYLYLRKQNKLGRLSDASASAPELLELIDMPGNPSKPYFFPLIDRGARTGQALPTFWRSRNIPGSWSPGSIGRLQAGGWLAARNAYAMPDDHANRALSQMLYGAKTSALALGAFFLRNDGLRVSGEPGPDDIIAGFRTKFRYDHDDEDEFGTIYSTDVPALDAPWLTVHSETESEPDSV
jgi:hypothetical protein